MSIELALMDRGESKCELCSSPNNLSAYLIPASPSEDASCSVLVCDTCSTQINGESELEANHWRCLNDSMWSQVPAVQVMAWRMLDRLKTESWAQDLLDMLYLEDDVRAWAVAGGTATTDDVVCRDSNGAVLQAGDTVTLIKDLVVKGANFTAKRGTAVRNIGLTDNPEHIEGRVNGTRIVLLSCYLKKSN